MTCIGHENAMHVILENFILFLSWAMMMIMMIIIIIIIIIIIGNC